MLFRVCDSSKIFHIKVSKKGDIRPTAKSCLQPSMAMHRAVTPNTKQIKTANADERRYVYSGWWRVIVI
jgi:hypothetical protein